MSASLPSAAPSIPGSQRRRLRLFLAGLCSVLVLTFGAVAWLQTRQFELISSAQRYQDDYVVWSLFQFEVDFLKLRQSLYQIRADATQGDSGASAAAAQVEKRFEIFVSRLGLVEDDQATRLLQRDSSYRQTLSQIRGFVQWADKLPLTADLMAHSPDRANEVLSHMAGLAEAIHDLSLSASHQVSQQAAERGDMVHHQARLSLWLTLLQCALTLGLIVLVVHQFRSLLRNARDQKVQAAQLLEAQHAAEAGSRAKSLFLANMSHELRTPMHGLLGMLDLLKGTRLSPEQQNQLKAANDSSQHLLTVLNDILDISKMEAGGISISAEAVQLRGLLTEVAQLSRSQAAARGLEFELCIEPDLPNWVSVDPTRLRQILLNLISNAIKFTQGGQVSLRLSRMEETGERGSLRFQVSDTGIGMDAATIGKLFQRFSQGDDSSSRRFGGSGLGLEISRNLARAMGGDIKVESRPGRGSTFSLELNLAECPAPTVVPPALPEHKLNKNLHILVSEDHPTNQAYLQAVLERLGHRAVFCNNGLEALHRLQQGDDFDLVLMDLHTPLMDGYQATRAIRALPAPKSAIKIIALSADAFAESRARALQVGMDGFLSKPVSIEVLAQVLGGQTVAPPPSNDEAEFDHAALNELRQNLPEATVRKLYATYISSLTQTRQALKQADNLRDNAALQAAAHSVKGAAANLGLALVQQPALALELSARQALHEGKEAEIAWADLLPLTQALLQAMQRSEAVCAEQGLL
ncbi:ATP-binding protein [Roseateles oligotrophus]|uniref:histidine kinase n=1 Tax=Roseateles oligotrophus TaxID=1769250 RepID=A0ABT2YGU0_9BURK|nr:ATP-binding protein [Roseateles oligotrophus]MCV2369255.1 response regulator [Roseateles oligotrophus]